MPGIVLALAALTVLLGIGWLSGAFAYAAWWLTNTTPPALALSGPREVVRGSTAVDVHLPPRTRIVEAHVDEVPLPLHPQLVIDTARLPDGTHRLRVTVADTSLRQNRGRSEFEFRSDNTPPRLTIAGDVPTISQGTTWLLKIQPEERALVQATLDGAPLDVQPGDGFGWAIVGIGASEEPRSLPLVITASDVAGNRTEHQAVVTVDRAQFPQDSVEVSAELLPLLQPQVRTAEDARLAPTYAAVTPQRLWDGPFRMPAQGEIVTPYGEVRSYNRNPFAGHHGGIDIAAPMGQPVRAPARARVALIDTVRLRGNLVILDHGLGVFTTYAHLSTVNVRAGQELEAGQSFANIGSTGLSEGPHLHWELWVKGVNVDPLDWVKRSYP